MGEKINGDNINICVIGVTGGQGKIIEEIMTKIFLNLMKSINLQNQKPQ